MLARGCLWRAGWPLAARACADARQCIQGNIGRFDTGDLAMPTLRRLRSRALLAHNASNASNETVEEDDSHFFISFSYVSSALMVVR